VTNPRNFLARGSLKRSAAALLVSICTAMASSSSLRAQQSEPRFLAKEQIALFGIGLKAEPARQVVPKDIATIVSTFLQAPTLPDGLPAFPPDAEVRATLRGPSFAEAQELVVKPNTPFNIPPLTVAGIHTLEDIRLTSHGEVLLRATPESTVIEVIEKLLITQVTARPLTAAEIREKGIVFDPSSFQAFNFTAAFAIQDHPITIDFPVVLPQLQGAQGVTVNQVGFPQISVPGLPSLQTLIPDTLKLQAQIPNLSVVGFTLKIPSLQGQDLLVPPIPGVIVIPGDIGFLNQFFSVMLMVGNVAPAGSNLVVSHLEAEIVLPVGNDLVAGSADDPLRMARTASGETARKKLVVQPGPDGQLGTFDDILTLGPGQTGNAEYLVEGMREGSHVVEMQMTGTLEGLPIGPVQIQGRAVGAVLVRNPAFTLTFTHPDVVSAGEPYSLDVIVTNTGPSPANFVSLNLFPRNVSGATVVGSSSREIETIAPGDSATVAFDLISNISGQVTAATLDSDENVAGRFALKTSVGELGVPVSPDSLVLPKESRSLPKDLRDAALGLLGKAWAVATAPAAALPKDVQPFSRKIVLDRAVEVAEAGFRVSLHEPLGDSAAHLAMDVMGNKYASLPQFNPQADDLAFEQQNFTGFDALRRQSVRGDRFADAVAAVLAPDLASRGAETFHADLASRWSYRPLHMSALLSAAGGGPAPYRVSIVDPQGRRVGGADASGKVSKQIPFSDLLSFSLPGGGLAGEMAVLASPSPGAYTVRLDRTAAVPDGAPYVLSLVLPDPSGGLRHLTFEGVAGQGVPLVSPSADPYQFRVEVVVDGSVVSGSPLMPRTAAIIDPPPTILGAVQQIDADLVRCEPDSPGIPIGRVIAVLFSEEVTATSVQDRVKPEDLTNYQIDGNQVVGVALQPGRRIAFLALRDPYGPFVPHQLTVSNVTDARGQAMPAASVPIEATMPDDGGVLSGRVIRADGTPVPFANVRLFYVLDCDLGPQTIGISSKFADAQGRYGWDFVTNRMINQIVAVDGESDQSRDLKFTVQRKGQRLNVDVVFLGRGTFQGRTLAEDGRAIAKTSVRVTSLTDNSQYGATTDDQGRFAIGGIPVGNILVEAVSVESHAQVAISESIPFAGATTTRDITLLGVATRDATLKTGTIQGFVYKPDGVTPIAGAPVIAFYQTRSQPGVPCPLIGDPPAEPAECAVAVVTSGPDGSFLLDKVPSGELRLYSFDQASLAQGGAHVVLPAGTSRALNILLAGGLGTVTGRVLDPGGAPVAGARVGGGFTLATTNAQGEFTLTDVPIGHRDIIAVSDVLGTSATVSVDIVRAGEVVGVTLVLQSVGSVTGQVVRADGTTPAANVTVNLFRRVQIDDVPNIQAVGTAITNATGGYRIDKVPMGAYEISAFNDDFSDGNVGKAVLKFHQQVVRADLRFRGAGGTVHGVVFDDDGHTPLKARVGLSGDQVIVAGGRVGVGFQYVQNYKIVDTNIADGQYSFSGLWVGPFTLRAVGQFSPDPIAVEGAIPAENQSVELNLRLQATSQISGIVYKPDGVSPVGENVVINYKSEAFKVICSDNAIGEQECVTIPQGIQSLNAVTDATGRFFFPVVNAGSFTLTAEDPATGKVGQIKGSVTAGQHGDLSLRLLGLADVTVQVFGSDTTTPIANAKVDVEQPAYPRQKKTLIAGPNGAITFGGGDAFSEGELAITATDQGSGLVGRGSARVVTDGQNVVVRVFLANATGTIFGTVYRSDGITTVPNAEIVISNAAGPLSFTVTGADGTYRQERIPIGNFTIDTFEAATARRAFASGNIPLANQEVVANLFQGALGVVRGTLVEGGTLTALKGWEITLQQTSQSGRPLPLLKTTTSIDGSWSFPGTSRGTFTLVASKPDVRGITTATGGIEREGQIVEVPLVVNNLRPLAGRVEGTVFNPDGSRAGNSSIEICYQGRCTDDVPPVRLTADANGFYFLDDVPLGRFSVTALAQITRNVGRRFGDMELDGDVLTVDVAMVGLTQITGTVIRVDGSPVTSAIVKLDGSPATGCDGPCTQGVKPANGTFAFVDVPARTFTVSAQDPISGLKGAVGGTVNPGEQKTVTVVLEATGSVGGRVLRAAGQPASGVVAELILGPGTPGERRLYHETSADGVFLFDPSPLASYTLNLQDPAGPGLAVRSGSVAGDGVLGDIVLDEAPPAVASTVPAASGVAVPKDQVVRIVFTEPILPGTVTAQNVVLQGPSGVVAYALNVTDGDTVATLTPLAPLKDETRYSIRVDGVNDRVGRVMAASYTSSFTTVDITAPTFTSISPAVNGSGVPIVSPVRIQFSEPIDPARFHAPAFTLTGPQGAIAGRLDYILGNTVLVFTPNLPLAEASAYRVQMSAAVDAAGNSQPQDLDYVFTTTDRTPPQILGLVAANNGAVIENTTASVTANVGASHDVAVVDWYINDVFAFAGRTLPFVFNFKAGPELGGPGSQIKVSAIATDTSGNRGTSPVSTLIGVIADQPPAVAIVAPAGGTSARNGDRIVVNVQASDDVGLTRIGYKANTGQPQDATTRLFDPAPSARTESFAFTIPPAAAPGSTIAIEASVVDTNGHVVQAVPVSVTVLDAVSPAVTITGTTSGAKVNPGQTTTAIVSADDLGGITSVTFTVGGILTSVQTRLLDPAQSSVAASFSIQVPQNARPGDSLTLDAVAVDRAGNQGAAARVLLPVADTVPPTVHLTTDTGSTEIARGRPFTVFADADDEIALSRVELSGQGAFTMSDAKSVSPPVGSARVAFTVNVPDTATPGAILNLRATAVDISGNVSAPALLTLSVKSVTDVTLPASAIVIAGESIPVTVQLGDPAPAGGQRVDFVSVNPNIASVAPNVQFAAGETTRTVQVTGVSGGSAAINALIQGVQRASMTVTTRGGIVRGIVRNPSLQPVGGVQLTINDTVTATTNGLGEYFAEGVPGPAVTVKAFDPVSRLRGHSTALMNRAGGFANVDISLVPAGAVRGDVKTAAGIPAGAGVTIGMFAATDPNVLLDFTFTDESSQFEFPLVAQGGYVLQATSTDGHRGRSTVTVNASGDEETAPIAFLGEGSVVGTVLDGAGVAVPRAPLTFTAISVFGATPPTSVNAEADGTFRFDRVLIGSFTVQAHDEITGKAGTASGAIAHDGDVVTADVHLSTFGNVRGVVRRPDGATVAVGALVTLNGHSTLTNELGEYSFTFQPLAPFTVAVNDQGTRQLGRATGTLTTQGETQTVDVTLHAQGSVLVTVTDASGNPVDGASVVLSASGDGFSDTLSGTTGSDGTVLIERVLTGTVKADASSGSLRGTASSTLNANELKHISVALEATGSIAGIVFQPDGQTPAAGVRVSTSNQTVTTGADGAYRFDGLPLPPSYPVFVADALGRTRARTTTPITLPVPGVVVSRDFTMVGLGTVTGRVLNPDSSSAQNLIVSVRSFNAAFGGLRSTTTNAGGFYTVEGVPVGAVSVSTGDVARLLLGEGAGTLATDGATATIDVLLISNAVTPPVQRFDANNYRFDIQGDGSLRTGSSIFRDQGGLLLDVVSGGVPTRFDGTSIGTIENGGRELAVRQQGLAGLNVTRKIFVPRDGYFARYLDIFSNPTAQPVTIDVRVISQTQHRLLVATSSGDAVLDVSGEAGDRWMTLDDDTDAESGVPATAFVFDGPGGAEHVAAATLSTTLPRDVTFERRNITVPANGTVAYLSFVAQQSSRASAQASAERLVQLPPEALDGLNLDEIAEIVNFAVPSDGSSAIPVLPALTGAVEGRVLASDGSTTIAGSSVHLRSANPLFGRNYQFSTGSDGRFAFAGFLNDTGSSRAIPVEPFTLQADHPTLPSLVQSPPVGGSFAAGSTTTAQDVVFSNTGFVSGTARFNGAPVAGAAMVASGTSGGTGFTLTTSSAADGSYLFALVPTGAVTVKATATVQGTTASATVPAVVAAGASAQADVTIDTIAPLVTIVSPAAGAQIDPRAPFAVTVTASDVAGVAGVGFSSSGAVVRAETRGAPTATPRTEVFTVPFDAPLPTGGSLTLAATATDVSGNQGSATVTVAVRDVVPPAVTLVSPSDGAVGVEPTANVVVQFSEPIDRASVTATSLRLSRGQSGVAVTFAFSDLDRTVTLIPAQPLTSGAAHTVTVDTGIRDVAGNAIASTVSSAFTTKPADTTPPQLSSITPAQNAVDVPVGSFITLAFSEPIDPATVGSASVRVSRDGVTLDGTLTLQNGNRDVRFTPAQPLPFGAVIVTQVTSAITDVSGNALVGADGNPLPAPLTFTFMTSTFGITSPARGQDLVENRQVTLEAQGSTSLGIATITFEVNGLPLPAVSGPPFTTLFTVPSASSAPTVRIVAVGRNSSNVEVARDELTANVVVGLLTRPALLGVPLGAFATLHAGLSSPISVDLPITLSVGDASIVTVPSSVVLPAGQLEVNVPVGGAAVGSTTINMTSTRGNSAVVASVSPLVAKTVSIPSPVAGVLVRAVPLVGRVFVAPGGQRALTVQLLSAPATGVTTVSVTSSNPAVARVDAPVTIAAGDQVSAVTIVTGIAGTATLTFRAGGEVRQITVVVGAPPADAAGPIVAPPVGVFVNPVPSLGRVVTPQAGHATFTLVLLTAPASIATPVVISSSNAAIATVSGAVTIAAGQQSVIVDVVTGAEGTAALTFRAGGELRQLTVVVGTPGAGDIPVTLARPVGVRVLAAPVAGVLFSGTAVQRTLAAPLLSAPRSGDTVVTISSSDPSIATAPGAATIPAGQQSVTFTVATGLEGVATLTLDAGGEQRQLVVVVGTPPASRLPTIVAPVVGVEVKKP
jgi:hypothetical protein